jgi:integrase
MPLREDFEKRHVNIVLRIVQGRFYIGNPPILFKRKLASFEELGFDAEGEPQAGESAKVARSRDNLLAARYIEILKELESADAERRPAGGQRLQAAWQEFIDVAKATRAPGTVQSYLLTGNHLIAAWGTAVRLGELSARHIDRLLIFLDARGLAIPTRNIHLNGLKAFFRWAVERELIDRPPAVRLLRVPHKAPRVGDPRQLAAVLDFLISKRNDPPQPFSTRMLRNVQRAVLLARYAGLRAGEIASLPLAQLDLQNGLVQVRMQARWAIKERKEKDIPLPEWFTAWLRDELSDSGLEGFFLDTGKGVQCYEQSHSLTSLVRRVADKAGAPGFHLHEQRAAYASGLLDLGVDIEVVSKLLGHSLIATTVASYAGMPNQRKLAAVAQIPEPPWKIEGRRGDARTEHTVLITEK